MGISLKRIGGGRSDSGVKRSFLWYRLESSGCKVSVQAIEIEIEIEIGIGIGIGIEIEIGIGIGIGIEGIEGIEGILFRMTTCPLSSAQASLPSFVSTEAIRLSPRFLACESHPASSRYGDQPRACFTIGLFRRHQERKALPQRSPRTQSPNSFPC